MTESFAYQAVALPQHPSRRKEIVASHTNVRERVGGVTLRPPKAGACGVRWLRTATWGRYGRIRGGQVPPKTPTAPRACPPRAGLPARGPWLPKSGGRRS